MASKLKDLSIEELENLSDAELEEYFSKNKGQRKPYKPSQSTQQNIPITDFVANMVVDDKENYSKIIEVKPQPFFFKKKNEQDKIISMFQSLLRVAPDNIHFKCLSTQADMSYQINQLKECIAQENDKNRIKMGNEYLNRLKEAQDDGVSRRFFISFPYDGPKNRSLEEIAYQMNANEARISNILSACGNEIVVNPEYDKINPNYRLGEIYYQLYNRDSYIEKPFAEHYNEILNKCIKIAKSESFSIPAKEVFAPYIISYKDNNYLRINQTFYKFLYIPSYGYRVRNRAGWLRNYVNSFAGVDVDVFLNRVPKQNIIRSIRRSNTNARIDMQESSNMSDSFAASAAASSSADYLLDYMAQGEDFYYISTIITVSDTNPAILDRKVEEIIKQGIAEDITFKENKFRQEETFNIVLPHAIWDDNLMTFKKSKRNLLSSGASSTYLFTTYQMMEKDGLYIADDRYGSPVLFDMFDRKQRNSPHVFISGETGSGKSVALNLLGLRASIRRMPTYIIAPEKEDEYRRIVNAIGGQFVSIGSGSNQIINVMEIFKVDEEGLRKKQLRDGRDSDDTGSYLANKISMLMDFFQLHYQTMTIEEKQILNEALVVTYENFGITNDNNSLWADNKKSKYKKMPIISDLIKVLEHNKDATRLSRALKLLTTGAGQNFNGQTNIDVNNSFFVIGLEHNSKDMMPLAVFMALDFCVNKGRENYDVNKLLICDEFWKMCYSEVGCERFLSISKLARSAQISMIVATQNIGDILAVENGKYGYAILDNCGTKILMGMKEHDAENVADMLDLTPSETASLSKFSAGQALLVSGENRIQLQFAPSETEKLLTFTDKETYAKFERQLREKEINDSVLGDEFIFADEEDN